jgi:protein ImuB
MAKRYLSIWFPHLKTDWYNLRHPDLYQKSFVLASHSHGRMVIVAANKIALAQGVAVNMVVADARAIMPSLLVFDDKPELSTKLLKGLAEWCIRFAPFCAMDEPDGLILDISGCAHLYGGEKPCLDDVLFRLTGFGYKVSGAIADTIGAAWAMARFGSGSTVVEVNLQTEAMLPLPPAALRVEPAVLDRLHKLGLRQVKNFIGMPRSALRRRFGAVLIQRLDQVLGHEEEAIEPVLPVEPYEERLPCMEPIVSATGIAIALQQLLDSMCQRLQREQKGIRVVAFKGYRLDGKIERVEIGTNRPSNSSKHLFKLFEEKLSAIEPALGIELFMLVATKVEVVLPLQEKFWEGSCGLEDPELSQLIDRVMNKLGADTVHRYLPDEHHWPERSIKTITSMVDKPAIPWRLNRPRPLQLLSIPEPIDVTAPIPDYPPMLFRYKGKLHSIKKADGPERIEQEWWVEDGQHRDYYCVEDDEGYRYWVFRLGHYESEKLYKWFIHGFFA